jgi:fatty acid desaturase
MNVTPTTLPLARRQFEQDLKSRASDALFGMKLALYATGLGCGACAALSDPLLLQGAGIVLLGMMFAHGVELQHQALHGQGFRHRRFNECVGVVLGLPMLVSFAAYQASHLRHHRDLGTPRNREFFDYGDQYGAGRVATLVTWAKRLLMPAHYLAFFMHLLRAVFGLPEPDESEDVARRIRRDHLLMLAAITALATASVLEGAPVILLAWLAPLMLVASPLHALIEMPEHYRCEVTSTDMLRNTRTIRTNAFMTWLTNGNNFHVEHHLMPGLPIDRLHDLHAVIADDIVHLHPSYRAFYADVLRNRLGQNESLEA